VKAIPYQNVAAIALLALAIAAAWCTGQPVVQRKRAEQAEEQARSAETAARALNARAALSEVCAAGREWNDGNGPGGLARLARAIHWAPQSLLAAKQAVLILNTWKQPPPLEILTCEDGFSSAEFSADGSRVVTTSWENPCASRKRPAASCSRLSPVARRVRTSAPMACTSSP
jgi:hypothetical protein